MHCRDGGISVALGLALAFATPALVRSQTSGSQGVAASDGPGDAASWTTGNKLAVGVLCRREQQGLVHGCERDHERDLLSAP